MEAASVVRAVAKAPLAVARTAAVAVAAAEAEAAERPSQATPGELCHRPAAQSHYPLEEEVAAEPRWTSPPRAWGRDKDTEVASAG